MRFKVNWEQPNPHVGGYLFVGHGLSEWSQTSNCFNACTFFLKKKVITRAMDIDCFSDAEIYQWLQNHECSDDDDRLLTLKRQPIHTWVLKDFAFVAVCREKRTGTDMDKQTLQEKIRLAKQGLRRLETAHAKLLWKLNAYQKALKQAT